MACSSPVWFFGGKSNLVEWVQTGCVEWAEGEGRALGKGLRWLTRGRNNLMQQAGRGLVTGSGHALVVLGMEPDPCLHMYFGFEVESGFRLLWGGFLNGRPLDMAQTVSSRYIVNWLFLQNKPKPSLRDDNFSVEAGPPFSLEEPSHHVARQAPGNAPAQESRAREIGRLPEFVASREGHRVGDGQDQCDDCSSGSVDP